MGIRYLYLVRHGQRATSLPDDGPLESGLSADGVEQGRLTAARLAHLPIATIYTSPLRRAAQTADILAERHPSAGRVTLPGLAESTPTLPRDYTADYGELTAAQFASMRREADSACEVLFSPISGPDRYELVASHGNLLRYLLFRALDLPLDMWRRIDLMNCSVSLVVVEPSHVWAAQVGDVGHLPLVLQTYVRERVAHAF